MEILGYEINIYVIIVIVAAIFVGTIILSISHRLGAKKYAPEKKRQEWKDKRNSIKLKETDQGERSARSLEKSPQQLQKRSSTVTPPSNQIVQTPELAGKFSKQIEKKLSNESPGIPNLQTKSTEVKDGTDIKTLSFHQEAGKDIETKKENENVEVSEEKGDKVEDEADSGLMDAFENNDIEESEVSDLAALLTDVDLETLNKLSEEMSQVLLKHNTGMRGRH